MILLWQKLKKLALEGIRLVAGVFLVLAILNVGLGAGALVDGQPFNSAAPGQFEVSELLHLQFFGFFHVHESLDGAPTSAVPGVSEYEAGVVTLPPAYTHFSYLNQLTRLESSDYGGSAGQKILTDFPGPHTLAGIKALVALSHHRLTNDQPVPDPFLKLPLKPPIF